MAIVNDTAEEKKEEVLITGTDKTKDATTDGTTIIQAAGQEDTALKDTAVGMDGNTKNGDELAATTNTTTTIDEAEEGTDDAKTAPNGGGIAATVESNTAEVTTENDSKTVYEEAVTTAMPVSPSLDNSKHSNDKKRSSPTVQPGDQPELKKATPDKTTTAEDDSKPAAKESKNEDTKES
jgi:hypothetical protein